MNIDTELKAIAAAEQRLLALQAALEAELRSVESQRRTTADFLRPAQLRETLRQLREGVLLGEGMDARLRAELNSPALRRFHFHSPGLAPRLCDCASAYWPSRRPRCIPPRHPAAPQLLPFRYTGPPWKVKVAGMRRQTGDVIQLTEEAASRWATVLEPVSPGVEVGAKT